MFFYLYFSTVYVDRLYRMTFSHESYNCITYTQYEQIMSACRVMSVVLDGSEISMKLQVFRRFSYYSF